MRASRIIVPAAAFTLAAAATYGAVAAAQTAPSPTPTESAAPVGVVAPFPYSGDADAAAQRWVDAHPGTADGTDAEYVAYAPDVPSPAPSTPASSGATPTPGASGGAEGTGGAALPDSPSGGIPGDGGVVDLCAGDSPPDYCPDGVGGTVELALDALPPMDGMVTLHPATPGSAPFPYFPECEPSDLAPGDLAVGMTVNRPASIRLTWSRATADGWEPHEVTLVTSGPAEDAWNAWAASDAATPTDPEQWIDVCHVIRGLDPGEYRVQATFTDASDSAQQFTYPSDAPLTARVEDASGSVPGHTRRPTIVLPVGVDRVVVNALAPSDQYIAMVAVPAGGDNPGEGGTCDASLLDPSHVLAAGDIVGVPLTQETLPDSVVHAPDYPYLPDQNLSLTSDFTLEEGTDYTLCLFWMDTRGDPSDGRPVNVEAIPVNVEDAYRVSLDVVGFYGEDGALDGSTVSGGRVRAIRPGGYLPGSSRECSPGLDVGFGPGGATWPDADRNLCTDMTGITGIVRYGIPVDVTLVTPSGDGTRKRSIVRVDPRCHGLCTPRDPEMVMVPLPEVDGHATGSLAIRVSYDATEGNGRTHFVVGDPRYGSTGPQTPDYPYVDIATSEPDMDGALAVRNGVDVDVKVRLHHADTRMGLHLSFVSGDPREPLCHVGAAPAPRTFGLDADGTTWTATYHGLCAGASYRIVVRDNAGDIVPVFGPTGWDTTGGHDFTTDPITLHVHGKISGMRSQDYDYSFTAYSNIWVRSPYSPGAYPRALDSAVDASWVDRLASGGWTMTDDGYSACGSGRAATVYAKPYTGTIEVVSGQPIRVEAHATYRTNQRDEDGHWTCDVTTGPGYLGGNVWNVDAVADVTAEQLLDGVTVRRDATPEGTTWVQLQIRAG